MIRRAAALVPILGVLAGDPAAVLATTAADLSSRLVLDGRLDDWAADERVLDAASPWPERPDDSAWGRRAEVRAVTVTWDSTRLYVGVDARLRDAALAVAIEWGGAGHAFVRDVHARLWRVDVVGMHPNLIVVAVPGGDVVALRRDAGSGPAVLDAVRAPRAWRFDPVSGDAVLELALPWREARGRSTELRMVVAVVDGGAGDAAPDPTTPLDARRDASARLDRVLAVPIDADADGRPDAGVSPRQVAGVEPTAPGAPSGDASVRVHGSAAPQAFAPGRGERTTLTWSAEGVHDPFDAFVTVTVTSMAGRRVRVIRRDAPRTIVAGAWTPDPGDAWDGRDDAGRAVDGGVYVVTLAWGRAPGRVEGRARVAVVVVR